MSRKAMRLNRREFMGLAAKAGMIGAVAGSASLAAPFLGPRLATVWAGPMDLDPNTVPGRIEAKTREDLMRMQRDLNRILESGEGGDDELRMGMIRLAMSWPLADLSQWTLSTLGDSATARAGLFFLMPLVRWMSDPFIFPVETGGTEAEREREMAKVFGLVRRMRDQGFETSLDNVGDASLSPEQSRLYLDYYLGLVRYFVERKEPGELAMSLKLSALVHDLDAALGSGAGAQEKINEIKHSLAAILAAASEARPNQRIFLRLDMEEYAYKDLTIAVFRQVVRENPFTALGPDKRLRLGLVIQAYLRDSAQDLNHLMAWGRAMGLRIPIRLVKGAYLEYEREVAAREGRVSPVWDNKPSTDANYEALSTVMLLNTDAIEPALATHNIRSMSHGMAVASDFGISHQNLEFQMLYGMGNPIKKVVLDMGWPLRQYIPAGTLARGLKYAGRRFDELAGSDNALARTMRGDYSGLDGDRPVFTGDKDKQFGEYTVNLLKKTLAKAAA